MLSTPVYKDTAIVAMFFFTFGTIWDSNPGARWMFIPGAVLIIGIYLKELMFDGIQKGLDRDRRF